MPGMRWMMRCRNNPIFHEGCPKRPAFTTHSSRLIGMARNISYFMCFSTLAYVQNLERAPIDAFNAARRESIS